MNVEDKIREMLISVGRFNRPGRANPCRYITIHETGNYAKGANGTAHGAYLRGDTANSAPVSWHYTVDDGEIVRHIPDGEDAYHAGDGRGDGNRNSIGIEICVNLDGDFEQALQNAAELVAYLMEKHQITIDKVVQHHRWNGKNCPYTLRTDHRWEDFLALCQRKGAPAEEETEEIPPYIKAVEKLAAAGVLTAPEYWKGGDYSTENVRHLLVKFADYAFGS